MEADRDQKMQLKTAKTIEELQRLRDARQVQELQRQVPFSASKRN
jgi:hypothetical protein